MREKSTILGEMGSISPWSAKLTYQALRLQSSSFRRKLFPQGRKLSHRVVVNGYRLGLYVSDIKGSVTLLGPGKW